MTDGNISECIIISDPLCKDDNARFSIVPLKPVSLPNYTPSPPAPASAAPGPSPPAPAGGPPTAPTPSASSSEVASYPDELTEAGELWDKKDSSSSSSVSCLWYSQVFTIRQHTSPEVWRLKLFPLMVFIKAVKPGGSSLLPQGTAAEHEGAASAVGGEEPGGSSLLP